MPHRGPRAPPLRRAPPRPRDGHPQPHARLVLRPGQYFDFDGFLAKAEQLVAEGADFLDVGGREGRARARRSTRRGGARAGDPGARGAQGALRRAAVGRHLAGVGAPGGAGGRRGRRQRHQRVRRPRLPAGGGRRGRVGRRHPHPHRPPRPRPRARCTTSPSSTRCAGSCAARAEAAEAAGIPRERVMVDAGLDLGKTEPQSLELLRAHDRLAALGWPLFLSASNKRFLGDLVGTDGRRSPRGEPCRPRARHRARAAASCAPTTCAALGAPPT